MNIKKLLCLVAYYGFARYFPASTSPMTHWARRIRRIICRPIFDKCGDNVNVECGARFATGGGIYIGHAYNITINQNAKIGRNCNIHKGVVIGQVNRGKRKGYPTIGDRVWIGINSAIVGKVTIGDDVLIAPNSFVNVDIPSHSVVFGNPCIIKHRDWATEGYVNNIKE